MAIERHETGRRMSRVVVHNGTVYLAGFVADDPALPIQGQTRQVLDKIDGIWRWAAPTRVGC